MKSYKSRICWSLISVGLLVLMGFGLNTANHPVHADVFNNNQPNITNSLRNQGDTKPTSKISINGLDGMNTDPDAGDLNNNELQNWVNSDIYDSNYANILNGANNYNHEHQNSQNNQNNQLPNPNMLNGNNNTNSNPGSNVNNDTNSNNQSNTNSLVAFSDNDGQVLNNYQNLIKDSKPGKPFNHNVKQNKKGRQIKSNRNHRHFLNKKRRHIASPKIALSYRYLIPKRAIHLHTTARFGNKHSNAGYLTPRKSVKILKAYRFNHQLRYAVKVGKRTFYITGNHKLVENAFYQKNIFNGRFGKTPKAVAKRRCYMYSNLHYTRKSHKRLVKIGRSLKIKRVINVGRKGNEVTRFHLTNGMYITANKSWVKVIK